MSMRRIVYVSDAVAPPDQADLEALVGVSATNNRRLGITGLLLYSAGHFMQAIEGLESNVRALLDRIRSDPRHENLLVLVDEPADARIFPHWRMGLLNLDEDSPLDRRALLDLVERSRVDGAGPRNRLAAVHLLRAFRERLPAAGTPAA